MKFPLRKAAWLLGVALFLSTTAGALAQKKYDTGATDTEIKLGTTAPYSGPASVYSTIPKAELAYIKMINERGGVNDRKINLISYDDAYSPPKTVEQIRKLVEGEQVLALFATIGSAPNSAIQKYVNQKGIPHLFVGSGAAKWADPANFPWSMPWQVGYLTEARVYAKYISQNYPGKTVGILFQNDDFGRDYIMGFHEVFGKDAPKIIVSEVPYDVTAPTIDSQVIQIKSANPDIFVNVTTPKFAAQAIKKIGELKWSPVHFLSAASNSVSKVLATAGLEYSQGILSAAYMKDPTDPQWKDDPGMNRYRAFMTKYYPEGDPNDISNVLAYSWSEGLIQVLTQCGDDLTRANVMKQMASLDMEISVFLPGIRVKTSPTDYVPTDQLRMMKFKGDTWELFGPLITASDSPS
jgi:ABC-type branched-subunit amino acid transport system substrate-binding protein